MGTACSWQQCTNKWSLSRYLKKIGKKKKAGCGWVSLVELLPRSKERWNEYAVCNVLVQIVLSINYTAQLNFTLMKNYSFSVGEFVHLEVLVSFPIKSFWRVGVEHKEQKKEKNPTKLHALIIASSQLIHLFFWKSTYWQIPRCLCFVTSLVACLTLK